MALMKKNNWKKTGNKLTKTYYFKAYNLIMTFVNEVMQIAEAQNHHPDISVYYDKVKLTITDHERGEVSDKCHKLKDTIDNLTIVTANN
jgi:4a-hydroxytetrahydrobiopterin dehydratase